jgi:nucleoside-diphosphate-sugar epimerase
MGDALAGTGKPFVGTTGTGYLKNTGAEPVGEEFAIDWGMPLAVRAEAERDIVKLAERGIRSSVVRLPLYVYGRNGSTFLPGSIAFSRENGYSPYVEAGENRYSVVHVDDAARLFVHALTDAPAGATYHAATDHGVSAKEIAEAIGTLTGTPARSLTRGEAEQAFGALVPFLIANNQVNAAKAERELGWRKAVPTTLLADVAHGSYKNAN